MEELEVREEIWGPTRGLWRESCQGLAAAGQDGEAEGQGGDLESGEGFVWVSPAGAAGQDCEVSQQHRCCSPGVFPIQDKGPPFLGGTPKPSLQGAGWSLLSQLCWV